MVAGSYDIFTLEEIVYTVDVSNKLPTAARRSAWNGGSGMIEIDIPGYRNLRLEHLVLDYNGTMACDGQLIDGVEEMLESLSAQIQIHVLTADTFGGVKSALAGTPCQLSILPPARQDVGKLDYVQRLGAEQTVCIGSGRNDRLMLTGSNPSSISVDIERSPSSTMRTRRRSISS